MPEVKEKPKSPCFNSDTDSIEEVDVVAIAKEVKEAACDPIEFQQIAAETQTHNVLP